MEYKVKGIRKYEMSYTWMTLTFANLLWSLTATLFSVLGYILQSIILLMPLLRQAVAVSTSIMPSTLTSCSSAWLSLSVCLSVRLSFHLAVRPFFCSSRHPCVCPHSFESRINQLHLSSTQLIFGKQSAVNQLLWQLAPLTRPGPVRPGQARAVRLALLPVVCP